MTFLIIAAVIAIAIAAFIATRPDSFRVERQTSISASAERIFPLIDDFHNWAGWSPWEHLDPAMKKTLSGRGAVYEWSGNKKAGQGRMEIIESDPSSKVVIRLDFLKPFESHNTTEITLRPEGSGTVVKWAMYGPYSTMSKLMTAFFNMDKVVGADFDRGLASIKKLSES